MHVYAALNVTDSLSSITAQLTHISSVKRVSFQGTGAGACRLTPLVDESLESSELI